jgi:hypothetical protein
LRTDIVLLTVQQQGVYCGPEHVEKAQAGEKPANAKEKLMFFVRSDSTNTCPKNINAFFGPNIMFPS